MSYSLNDLKGIYRAFYTRALRERVIKGSVRRLDYGSYQV